MRDYSGATEAESLESQESEESEDEEEEDQILPWRSAVATAPAATVPDGLGDAGSNSSRASTPGTFHSMESGRGQEARDTDVPLERQPRSREASVHRPAPLRYV